MKNSITICQKNTRAHTHACTSAYAGQGYFHLQLSELNTDDFTNKKKENRSTKRVVDYVSALHLSHLTDDRIFYCIGPLLSEALTRLLTSVCAVSGD